MRRYLGTWMIAALSSAACAPDSPRGVEEGSIGQQPERLAPAEPRGPGSVGIRFDSTWTVAVAGIGPIRVGHSLAEVAEALPGTIESREGLESCDYISPLGWPSGVLVMVVDGRVARVDVREGTTATSEGARIGSTEGEIHALYPGRVEVQPHKYTAGHYLIVAPAGTDSDDRRLVFETDGERVERYRAGVLPAVEWVEGCG